MAHAVQTDLKSMCVYSISAYIYIQGRNHQIRIGQAKFLLTINNRLFNNSSNDY